MDANRRQLLALVGFYSGLNLHLVGVIYMNLCPSAVGVVHCVRRCSRLRYDGIGCIRVD